MKWMRYVLCAAAVCSIAGCGNTKTASSPNGNAAEDTVSLETAADTESDIEAETLAEDESAVTVIGETTVDFEEGSADETAVDLAPDGSILDSAEGSAGKNLFQASDFSLQLPDDWEGCYVTSESRDAGITWVGFYAKKCQEEIPDSGWLFSIASYPNDTYEEQPSYEVIDIWEDLTYIVIYPTEVQFEGASKKARRQYKKMAKAVDEIVATFERTQFE